MTRLGRFCALCGVAFALLAGPQAAAQTPDRNTRLARANEDFQRGDHANAWFGFWGLAREGLPAAQFNLGQFYREGIGIAADLTFARYWYAEAAAQGHAYAQYNLGLMYERGDGTTPDLVEAKAWYRRAAAQDVPGARTALERLERPERSRRGEITPRGRLNGLAEAAR
jgi:TPR repeat protein